MFSSECSLLRLAQSKKCEFTTVNDHFEGKNNADSGPYRQILVYSKIDRTTLINKFYLYFPIGRVFRIGINIAHIIYD